MKNYALKELVSYKSATRLMMWVAVISVALSIVAVVLLYVNYTNKVNELSSKIYVMNSVGDVVPAQGKKITTQDRVVEYKAHVKKFVNLWYGLDENSYQNNIDQGLYMLGNCGKQMLLDYEENNVYDKLVENNVVTKVKVNNVTVNTNTTPPTGVIDFVQIIKRPAGELKREMSATFTLEDVSRSDNNPHGVKINDWKIIKSNLIK